MAASPAPSASDVARGSVLAPRLALHLHVALRGGSLVSLRLAREADPRAPDPEARPLLARLARHAETGREDFRDVPLDLSAVSPFDREVLETLMREVPPGETVSYAELARLLGRPPGAARAVGGAMARNPIPVVVPCHRVLPKGTWRGRGPQDASSAAGRRIGSYSGEGGWETKMALLRIERARGAWAQASL